VDMTLFPVYDLVAAAQETGLRYFTLAFIVADSQGQPAWGGFSEYALGTEFDTQLREQIAGLRALGGDVIVSFGGASNRDMAEVITDVTDLQAAYQSVIDAYGLTQIDFDVEGAAVADRESVDRRNQAIAGLQQAAAAAGTTLEVSYTLPVLPSGLTADGVYVLESAVARGVNIGVVNIMAMDYGDSAAPNPDGQMGDYAIEAATSLFEQLGNLYGSTKTEDELWQMVGVTPMIGLNDVTTEVFDQQEARELLAFAQEHGIGRISFWSLNRDQQNANGEINYVDLKSSSILQDPFEFSEIFIPFTS
ncbi:MAG: sugar hydrolase, partial [Planctomycetes bacterium]|nr:sugar hydrolase [Planctomycetota bacterium]